jgi:uncharacterized Rmd1/YagE family protein
MIRAEITFYGRHGGRSFGSEREYADEKHIERYIAYMERKGFNLDEIYYSK